MRIIFKIIREGTQLRIVIVGIGKLGYSIAERLSEEGHDVVVVDNFADRLETAKRSLDVLTLTANGSSPITMTNPDVQGADMLIATTDIDEVNMISCILAKKHGIKHTVARIRDMEFMSEAKEYLKKNFDIDLMLNPELITALEINRILMTPAALNVEDFADGRVRLFETKIHSDSRLANIPLKDLDMPKSILAAMIFRAHRMIIPHGDDKMLPGDNAYFVGSTQDIEHFSKKLVKRKTSKVRRVVIIGAGRTGRFLAPMLDRQGVLVKIIDLDRSRLRLVAEKLHRGFPIHGDGTNLDLLREEGIKDAEVLIALTDDDRLNLMLALLAKNQGVERTIVQVARTEYIDLMEQVGVDTALSSRMLSTSEVMAFVRQGGVVSVSFLEGNKAEAIEVIVQDKAPATGKPLKNAGLPKECLVCAYVRDTEAFIPNGDTVLLPGDRVILLLRTNFVQKVVPYFNLGGIR